MSMDRGRFIAALKATKLCYLVSLGSVIGFSALNASVDRVGAEYSVLGPQAGDQFFPQVALGEQGGYLIWQDNNIDEDGLGIRAVKIDANFNAVMGAFRVNQEAVGDQQRPAITLLPDGGAAFAWESQGDIKVRFIGQDGLFTRPELEANSYVKGQQQDAAITTLDTGNVVVVWSSAGQDGDMFGVYGQIFSPEGIKIGAEFFVNQSVFFNQRTPTVTALNQGDFAVSWVSEVYAGTANRTDENGRIPNSTVGGERYEVGIVGRIFDENGLGVSDEISLSDPSIIAANPRLVSLDEGFMVFYSGRENLQQVADISEVFDGWDIYGGAFNENGEAQAEAFVVNGHTFGDQLVPSAARVGDDILVSWTSLEQDGDREGVFGKLISVNDGTQGEELQINSVTGNKQFLPAVGGNDAGQAIIIWGGYTGGQDSFDLYAQRFATGSDVPRLEAPYVFGVGYWSLRVTWPGLAGMPIDSYELYLDGADVPVLVSGNSHTFTGLSAGTEHTVELVYILPDGTKSPPSTPAVGETWGRDENSDMLPDSWQREHFGLTSIEWPGANVDSDGDGVSNRDELLAGTSPVDAASLLRTEVVPTAAGLHLQWNTHAGGFYQVQVSTDIDTWFDAGAPRLAVGDSDSISIVNDQGIAVYRVLRLR